ncbi:WYL domain-containing protein [Streptosporangium amethystogenes]|uniref:WYL domain-containing protein n=1 Tax=Streptosporangium amethystogenes TaxID=2002 RepID=UPI00379A6D0B
MRTPPRRVQPHHLVAWDLDREDWRTFRADRITPRTTAGPRFTPREPPGDEVAAFVVGRFRGLRRLRRLALPWRGDP